ncbi:MAG: glycine cleavage system aminomethyltransferase GcvT [Gemmataceae bacterium]
MALRTTLYEWHQTRGGTLVEFGGWMLPVRYSTITEEHQAVRSVAGLFDISHMGRLHFSGTQAETLLQRLTTNNVATMKVGQVRYGLVCNAQGGIRDDVLIYRWADSWSMVVNAANRDKIVAHFQEHMAGTDVVLEDRTMATAMLALQGPQAMQMQRGLFELDAARLKYYFAAATRFEGVDCLISRTGYTGEDGLEVMLAADKAVQLADAFVSRGAKPCGLGARDTLRLEAAMPLYGHELTEEIDPLQAGLGWAVKLDKGDFWGRDALVARQQTPQPVRVGLRLEGRRAAREGAEVRHQGRAVGKVTSGTIPPTLAVPIAMGYVAPEVSAVGTELEVALGNATTTARVVSLPFYRRS